MYESTPQSGAYYHVTASYWASGLLNQLSGLPSLPTITYSPEGEGRVAALNASTGQNPVSCNTAPCTSYNAAGLPTSISLGSGSGDTDAYIYDPNTNRVTVLVQPEVESGRFLLNGIPPFRGVDFQGMGVYRSMRSAA